jgi:hypothetical protein
MSVRINRAQTPDLILALHLLDLFFAPWSKMFNRCHNHLDKDLPPLNTKWFHARTTLKLQTLGIRVFKGLQPLGSRRRLKQPQLVSNVDKRVITPQLVISSLLQSLYCYESVDVLFDVQIFDLNFYLSASVNVRYDLHTFLGLYKKIIVGYLLIYRHLSTTTLSWLSHQTLSFIWSTQGITTPAVRTAMLETRHQPWSKFWQCKLNYSRPCSKPWSIWIM